MLAYVFPFSLLLPSPPVPLSVPLLSSVLLSPSLQFQIQDKIDLEKILTPMTIEYPASLGEDTLSEVVEFYAYTVN
jgi:hypothetical protein